MLVRKIRRKTIKSRVWNLESRVWSLEKEVRDFLKVIKSKIRKNNLKSGHLMSAPVSAAARAPASAVTAMAPAFIPIPLPSFLRRQCFKAEEMAFK